MKTLDLTVTAKDRAGNSVTWTKTYSDGKWGDTTPVTTAKSEMSPTDYASAKSEPSAVTASAASPVRTNDLHKASAVADPKLTADASSLAKPIEIRKAVDMSTPAEPAAGAASPVNKNITETNEAEAENEDPEVIEAPAETEALAPEAELTVSESEPVAPETELTVPEAETINTESEEENTVPVIDNSDDEPGIESGIESVDAEFAETETYEPIPEFISVAVSAGPVVSESQQMLLDRPQGEVNMTAPVILDGANNSLMPVWHTTVFSTADLENTSLVNIGVSSDKNDSTKITWTLDNEMEIMLLSMLVNSGAANVGYNVNGSRINDKCAYPEGSIPYLQSFFIGTAESISSQQAAAMHTSKGTFELAELAGGQSYDLSSGSYYISTVKTDENGETHVIYADSFRGIGAPYNGVLEETSSGSNGRQFSANFNGNGANVKVNIDTSWTVRQTGFFSNVESLSDQTPPVIENLNLSGSVKSASYSGGAVGYTSRNRYFFRNINVSDMTVTGMYAGGFIGGIGPWSSVLLKNSGVITSNIDTVCVDGSAAGKPVKITGTSYAGGLVGYIGATCMSIEDSTVYKADISSDVYSGGAVGGVSFGALSNTHAQTDYWQINNSVFRDNSIYGKTAAGGVVGYQHDNMKRSQINMTEINATCNVISGGKKGTILGTMDAAAPTASQPGFGFYGINVYDAGTTFAGGAAVTQKGYVPAGVDFRFIRFTDIDTILASGATHYPTEYSGDRTAEPITLSPYMMSDIYEVEQANKTSDGVEHVVMEEPNTPYTGLKYFLYDNEQSASATLDEYFEQINRAITSDGITVEAAGENEETVAVMSDTLDNVREISYDSRYAAEDRRVNDSTGNLIWRSALGFRVRKSDGAKEWTEMKVTYTLSDLNQGKYSWPLSISTDIPVKAELTINVASVAYLKKGEALIDQNLLSAMDIPEGKKKEEYIESLGYSPSNRSDNWVSINNDGVYTGYMELAYSGDRFLIDTTVYDKEGNPVCKKDAEGNPVYKTDEEGNILCDYVLKTDEEGNTVYQVDDSGKEILDAEGNRIPVL